MNYIDATENLTAFMNSIPGNTDHDFIVKVASAVPVPEFKPKFGVIITVTDVDCQSRIQSILPSTDEFRSIQIHPIELKKYDLSNFHMDFIVAAYN